LLLVVFEWIFNAKTLLTNVWLQVGCTVCYVGLVSYWGQSVTWTWNVRRVCDDITWEFL
jgi:hypothetical protein